MQVPSLGLSVEMRQMPIDPDAHIRLCRGLPLNSMVLDAFKCRRTSDDLVRTH